MDKNMLPTINELTSSANSPVKRIRKSYFTINSKQYVGVMLRKVATQGAVASSTAGMVVWRIYSCKPADGETPFGREIGKFRQYYVTGGLALSYVDAARFMRRAIEQELGFE